uniref:Uncharacterized protein n=1 Tax=Caenorhabditis japonica TaxID=281687 RepID=A0A8R1E935_CAEJA
MRTNSKGNRCNYTSQVLPETSMQMQKRRRDREESQKPFDIKIPAMEPPSDELASKNQKLSSGFHFKFEPPKDIFSPTPKLMSKKKDQPAIPKQVSFVSPKRELEPVMQFPTTSFQTPSRPFQMDQLKPPPLLKSKRGTVAITSENVQFPLKSAVSTHLPMEFHISRSSNSSKLFFG